jgi:hypothetical protein
MFFSQTFSKILLLVFSAMDNFELLTVSIFVVAITTSWKVTHATSTSLYLKEMFPNICLYRPRNGSEWFSPFLASFVEP